MYDYTQKYKVIIYILRIINKFSWYFVVSVMANLWRAKIRNYRNYNGLLFITRLANLDGEMKINHNAVISDSEQ